MFEAMMMSGAGVAGDVDAELATTPPSMKYAVPA